jgi:hypothetical protein
MVPPTEVSPPDEMLPPEVAMFPPDTVTLPPDPLALLAKLPLSQPHKKRVIRVDNTVFLAISWHLQVISSPNLFKSGPKVL